MQAVTGDDRFEQAIEENAQTSASEGEEGGTNMCEMLDRLMKKSEAKGRAEGEAIGEARGVLQSVRNLMDSYKLTARRLEFKNIRNLLTLTN